MTTATDKPFNYRDFLSPRHWATWLGLGLLKLTTYLPYSLHMWLGRRLGDGLYYLLPSRRHIAQTNIALCFPHRTADQREALVRQNFQSSGMSLMEMGSLWFRDVPSLLARGTIEDLHHLEDAQSMGQGVILLQAHFVSLEFCGGILARHIPVHAIYDPPKNPLYAQFLDYQRNRFVASTIENKNIRKMVRALKQGEIVWYSPDQWVKPQHGAITCDYFGVPAATTPATARMVQMTGARVVPYIAVRNADHVSYTLKILPPLEDFSGDDLTADTQRLNDLFQEQIQQHPQHYLWLHKRFKPPTDDANDPYRRP